MRHGLDCSSAGLNPTDDGKRLRRVAREVSTADGVTINGGIREGWQGQWRRGVGSQNTTFSMSEMDDLNVLHWSNPRGQNRNLVSTGISFLRKAKLSSNSWAICFSGSCHR